MQTLSSFVYITLWAGATLLFASVVAGLYSARLGLSFLLVFLIAGMIVGQDGLIGLKFEDFGTVFWVGNAALAVILLDGGLRTKSSTFRTGLKPGLALASVGVLISAGVTGAAAMALLGLDWRLGLLAGAVVGSTDAAAVFSVLGGARLRLPERVSSTLEIESGLNDPTAVALTLLLIGIAGAADPAAPTTSPWGLMALQVGLGAGIGLGAGTVIAALLRRLPIGSAQRGLAALVLLSAGVAVFAGCAALGGSGFLAVYLFGVVLRARAERRVLGALSAMDGYAWLVQAAMFLLLGLLVTPSRLMPTLPATLAVAGVLMFIARPLAVVLCLAPLRFKPREQLFIAWVGLRGAVPIVLAVFPLIAEVPGALQLLDLAFVVVLASLVLQGTTLGWLAHRLNLNLPSPDDERAQRRVYGDFVLDPDAAVAAVFGFYALPPVDGPPGETLAAWLTRTLRTPPVMGDAVAHGSARVVVRAMHGAHISAVGLQWPADAAGASGASGVSTLPPA
ncbi:MAG: potassium/proton antiporter [Rubrivivax sp.]